MLAFIKENYFMALYAIALFVALLRYRFYYDSILRFFPILIAYAFLSELLGLFIRVSKSYQIVFSEKYPFANNIIFNIYDSVFFFFFFYVFHQILKRPQNKLIIKCAAIAYLLAIVINPVFQDFYIFPQIFAITVGSIALVVCIVLFFKEKKQELHAKNLLLNWVSFGLLAFYLFFPIIMIVGFLNYELYQKLGLKHLHHFLIVLMYTCFIIGFIKMRRMKPLQEESL